MWSMCEKRWVHVVPVVVAALESGTKKLGQWIEKLWVGVRIGLLQKTTLAIGNGQNFKGGA